MNTNKNYFYVSIIFMIALVAAGCTPFGRVSFIQLDGSSIAINSETFKSYDFIELEMDQSTNPVTIKATQVPSGRNWDFGMTEKNVTLACVSRTTLTNTIMNTFNGAIHIDIGPHKTDGSYVFDCKANNTSFVFEVQYQANLSHLVSSNLFKTPYIETKEKAKISMDGKKVLYVSYGQVYLKDLNTDAIVLVSSSDSSVAQQANAPASNPQMSSDGTKVVFTSAATNLITGSSGLQIYLKDLTTNTLSLISSVDGSFINKGNGTSDFAQINSQGTKVVFQSAATNLVSGSSGQQIFMKDLTTDTFTLLSSTDGTVVNQGNATSSKAFISALGDYVSFTSTSTNLISGGSTGTQIFVKRISTGAIRLASSVDGSTTTSGNNVSDNSSVSDDGNKVVFQSSATNLTATASANKQIFLKNFTDNSIKLLSSTDSTVANQGNNESVDPIISNDGLKVAFTSKATNLIATTAFEQVYLKNLTTDSLVLISSTDGSALNASNALSTYPNLSKDAGFMVFKSEASNLVSGAIGSLIYVKNLSSGSISAVISPSQQTVTHGNGDAFNPQISADGEKVVFSSSATNMIDNLKSKQSHIYIKNLKTGIVTLVSSKDGTGATAGNGYSYQASMTPDAKKVVFISNATNLVTGATGYQVYMKDTESGTLTLISSHDGTAANAGNNFSQWPTISDDGKRVAFSSNATNLVDGYTMSGYQTYVKDIPSGKLFLVSNQISNGGGVNTPVNNAYLDVDSPSHISADGTKVAFSVNASNIWPGASGAQAYIAELSAGNTVSSIYFASSNNKFSGAQRGNSWSWSPKFTRDGKKIIFYSYATNFIGGTTSAYPSIFIKDLVTEEIKLVSSLDGTGANRGNQASYNASPNYDGSIIVFQSSATNLVPGTVTPGGSYKTHIFIKNMNTNTITMASSKDGTAVTQANSESFIPDISDDGKVVTYSTSATNLAPNVSNSQIYIFIND